MNGLILLNVILVVCSSVTALIKPHIVVVLVDDLGWANVGFHRPTPTPEVVTPSLDALVAEGIELTRLYAFKYCSPTRSALQTGRNPIHVNVVNPPTTMYNPKNNISGFSGIPRNMTGIAKKMQSAGYATHAVGKWDCGMATHEHTPVGRGYQSWLGYFGHCNDYWTEIDKCGMSTCGSTQMVDLWSQINGTSGPGVNFNNSQTCSQNHQKGCLFEDDLFQKRVHTILTEHDTTIPLFLFWAIHAIHGPREVPQATYDKFDMIDFHERRMYHALVNYMDEMVGSVVALLKNRAMWDSTLFVLASDNGGDGSANNWPLRGAKFSNWEGGIHVVGLVSGGLVPVSQRGTKNKCLGTLWDFYATFCDLAGISTSDEASLTAGLPPVDSISLWPCWSGTNNSCPRTEIAIGGALGNSGGGGVKHATTTVEGIIVGRYKLLLGSFDEAIWTGPQFPNKTTNTSAWKTTADCTHGCLYDLDSDPTEHNDLALEMPDRVHTMIAKISIYNQTVFSPNRGTKDPTACDIALTKYGGFWGPFLELEEHENIKKK